MAPIDLSIELDDELPDDLTIEFLQRRAMAPKQKMLAQVAAQRHQHVAKLYYAVKDKAGPTTFEAGLGPAGSESDVQDRMDVDGDDSTALKEFMSKYKTLESLNALDLSLAPMSPSPPPSPVRPTEAATAVTLADTAATSAKPVQRAAESSTSAAPAPTIEASSSQTGSTAVAMTPVTANSTITVPSLDAKVSHPSTIPTVSVTPTASTSALPYGTPPALASSVSPAPPATISPAALTGAPPLSPVPASRPYTSMFGISEISSTYVSTLPELPQDVLRSRLVSSVRKKGKEKAAAPPDLYKMHIKAQHTGAKNFLGRGKRVHNVLSTHDWGVGLEELRALRAFERIEQLKADKAWSFRQPKKQRVGLVPKAHWDHLMDEMRWLQTDFRQEHRWKVATAHAIARAVRDWHLASPEDREKLRVKTVIRQKEATASKAVDGASESMSRNSSSTGMDVDVDADGSVDGDADADEDADAEGEEDVPVASTSKATGQDAMLTSTTAASAPLGAVSADGPPESRSETPNKANTAQSVDAKRIQASAAAAAHIQNLIALRAPVFELGPEATVVDPRALSNVEDDTIALNLSALFPDLPLYSDTLSASDPSMEKRIEDSSAWAGRLSHVTRLLETKPLLVSTVQPSKTRTTAGWDPATAVMLDESKEVVDITKDTAPHTASLLFAGPKARPKEPTIDPLSKPADVANPELRAASLHWAPEEDQRVLALVKQYGSNWGLVAEIFNSTMTRPASDYRLPWDIFDRWDKLAGPSSRKVLPDGTEVSIPLPEYAPPPDRANKAPQFANFEGSRKRLRHLTVFDAMRKVQKKREITASKQPPPGPPRKINMGMHDSHNLPPRPLFTPMEWHAVKLEQEQQKLRLRAQQQAEFAAQQQRLQAQQQQAAVMAQQQGQQAGPQQPQQMQPQPQQQQMQQQPQQVNGALRFQASPTPQAFIQQQNAQNRPMQLNMQQAAAIAAAHQRQQQVGSPNGLASPGVGHQQLVPSQANGPIPTSQGPVQLTPEQIAYVRAQAQAQAQGLAQAQAAQAQRMAQQEGGH